MDRRVKERLIGASILVVLVVLIVPELLSGPKPSVAPSAAQFPVASGAPETVRVVTVDLATSKATAEAPASAAPAPAAAAASAATPGEAESAPGGATPRTAAAGEEAPTALAPTITTLKAQQSAGPALPVPGGAAAAAPTAAPATAAGRHGWSVQLGSFASKSNAEVLIRRVRTPKTPVYLSPIGSGRALRYRVRVGPMADRAAAERMLVGLQKEGHPGTLVPP